MMRIVVFRAGGLGDFLVTLPSFALLRQHFPDASIELVGHAKWADVASAGRYYFNRVHAIDKSFWAPLFHDGATLPSALIRYMADFDLVISFLSGDANDDFGRNLTGLGFHAVDPLGHRPPKPGEHLYLPVAPRVEQAPAAAHFCHAFRAFGWEQDDLTPRLFLTEADHDDAFRFLRRCELAGRSFVAVHPGSGSRRKNWPIERWLAVTEALEARHRVGILWILGEAEEALADVVMERARGKAHGIAMGLPIPALAAVLSRATLFLGHDSGVSHLAGAAGTNGVVLFGPTDPTIWAPAGARLHVLHDPGGLPGISVADTIAAAERAFASPVTAP